MRLRFVTSVLAAFAVIASSQVLFGQAQSAPASAKATDTKNLPYDPHDLTGPWVGYNWVAGVVGPGKGPGGITNVEAFDQKIPEPPLTEWAKQHLLLKSISHDSLGGPHLPGWDAPGRVCPNTQAPCFAADPNGVPANDVAGAYPGKDCEPLGPPAIYDFPQLGSLEFVPTPDGSRLLLLYEYHREWRTLWLNRDHPKIVDSNFEGDSSAHWEGDTLVVDTIGFNGKGMITGNIGHTKSDAFHLEERFRRVDHDNLVIDMTYSDPKAWGDKSWPGFKKFYHLTTKDNFQELMCSPSENRAFDVNVLRLDPKSQENK
jgi:hypothetical protein